MQNDNGQWRTQLCAWDYRWKNFSSSQPGWADAVSCQEKLIIIISLIFSNSFSSAVWALHLPLYTLKKKKIYRIHSSNYFLSPSKPLAMQFFCFCFFKFFVCLFCFSGWKACAFSFLHFDDLVISLPSVLPAHSQAPKVVDTVIYSEQQAHKASTTRTPFYIETEAQRCFMIFPKPHNGNRLEPDLNAWSLSARSYPSRLLFRSKHGGKTGGGGHRERTLLKTHVSERLTKRTRSSARRKEEKGDPEQRCRISYEYERRFSFGSQKRGHVMGLFIFMELEMERMHQVRETAL